MLFVPELVIINGMPCRLPPGCKHVQAGSVLPAAGVRNDPAVISNVASSHQMPSNHTIFEAVLHKVQPHVACHRLASCWAGVSAKCCFSFKALLSSRASDVGPVHMQGDACHLKPEGTWSHGVSSLNNREES